MRKRVIAEHEDLTLTKLYNVIEALRDGRALTDPERDIHDRGLVTLILQHHDAIDTNVAKAYGWPKDLPDEEILTRLVALNKERAAEETKGVIRWLRPEYQAPEYKEVTNGCIYMRDIGHRRLTISCAIQHVGKRSKRCNSQYGASHKQCLNCIYSA